MVYELITLLTNVYNVLCIQKICNNMPSSPATVPNKLRLVRFESQEHEFAGFQELTIAGATIRNVAEKEYIVTDRDCSLLSSKGIRYTPVKDF